MAAKGEKDKKAESKTVVMNDLWFFMNFCIFEYEWKNEIFVQSCSIFHFIFVFLRQNFAGHLVW